jgi:cytoskeletal protein RodZ
MLRAKNRFIRRYGAKKIGISVLAVLFFGLLVGLWWHSNHRVAVSSPTTVKPAGPIDYSPAKPADNAANDQRKGSAAPSTTLDNGPSSSTTPISITITGANPDSSQSIKVSALVQGVSSGTCTFNFSQSGGGTIKKSYSEAVQSATNYYSCPPTSVVMPSKGDWYVSASLSSGSQTSSAKWAGNPVSL